MATYHKGPLVWAPKDVASQAQGAGRLWAIYESNVYDLTDYYNTVSTHLPLRVSSLLTPSLCFSQITLVPNNPGYAFLNTAVASIWQGQSGTDITSTVKALKIDPATLATNMDCIKTLFYVGQTDFRLEAKCQVQPYLLLTFSIILVSTILAKFLAALQLGSKRSPELRDKFVICKLALSCTYFRQDVYALLAQAKYLAIPKAKSRSRKRSIPWRRLPTTTRESFSSLSAME